MHIKIYYDNSAAGMKTTKGTRIIYLTLLIFSDSAIDVDKFVFQVRYFACILMHSYLIICSIGAKKVNLNVVCEE